MNEDDDWSLFQAQNYLELEYHPNDFYNYEMEGTIVETTIYKTDEFGNCCKFIQRLK